ncbi:MAG: glutamate cyclase domain-containing protein [Gemmataceae bacterium]
MTADEKLAAILAAVQTDPGHRGLARDPHDNLFIATAGDFQAACRSVSDTLLPIVDVVTGFVIPTAEPPTFETDGPLGAVFLACALAMLDTHVSLTSDPGCVTALNSGLLMAYPDAEPDVVQRTTFGGPRVRGHTQRRWVFPTHVVALERVGPAFDGRSRTMRGRDITDLMLPAERIVAPGAFHPAEPRTIGIGDGGNEIGMGKISHETIVKNIPNGDLIHCRVPTDHLIVAGVSNWGAYALAAGVYVLRGVTPPPDLFDPDREREILDVMVREGPLVDGVTGKQTATVDGLTWEEYAKPLIRIREILGS